MATDEFAGKRALVTGGTKGMGEAIVARLRASGGSMYTRKANATREAPMRDQG